MKKIIIICLSICIVSAIVVYTIEIDDGSLHYESFLFVCTMIGVVFGFFSTVVLIINKLLKLENKEDSVFLYLIAGCGLGVAIVSGLTLFFTQTW